MPIQKLELQGKKFKEPIFIVGCGRSGTTLLINIIGNHKNIYSILWETCFFREIKPKVYTLFNKFERKKDFNKLTLAILTIFLYGIWDTYDLIKSENFPKDVIQIFEEIKILDEYKSIKDRNDIFNLCANYLTLKDNKKRWIEKTPGHIRTLSRIFDIYPNAKIITIFRDPKAVYCSWKYSDFFKTSVIRALVVFIPVWIMAYKISKKLLKTKTSQFYLLRYEDLINNPEDEIKKLCDFIGEEFESSLLDIKKARSVLKDNVNYEDFNKEPIERWKQKLSDGEILLIDLTTKQERKDLSYKGANVKLTLLNIFKVAVVLAYSFFQLIFIILNKIKEKHRFYLDQIIYELQSIFKRR